MESTGKLHSITMDYTTGKPIVAFLLDDKHCLDNINELNDKLLKVTACVFRQKRSLNANGYFHALCGKIAKALTISEAKCKNVLIGRYGYPEYADPEALVPMVIKTNIPPERMLEYDEPHCRVAPGGDEKTWFYYVMRPSHTYDTMEFSKLLDGTIAEAQDLGIDTITVSEKDKMLERWAKQYEKRSN